VLSAAVVAAAGALGENLLVLAPGAAGLLWLMLGLATRWSAALAAGIVFLGAEQAVRLATGPDSVDPWTPAYAAGLLLVAELAWWSIEPRVPAWSDYGLTLRRLAAIVGACAAGALIAAVVVLAAGAPLTGGVGLELTGVLAAVAAVAVVATLARLNVREPE
jgi:hypothetical protein